MDMKPPSPPYHLHHRTFHAILSRGITALRTLVTLKRLVGPILLISDDAAATKVGSRAKEQQEDS